MDKLNLDYVNALKLILPIDNRITIELVGCGGTGSWLAPAVARVAKILIDKFHREVNLLFCDPDTVEEKNCFRQNFCEAEIGLNKAITLAERYGLSWGVEIGAIPQKFDGVPSGYFGPILIIGCVDNALARKEISKNIDYRTCWLDCGNEKNTGQVLLGTGTEAMLKPFTVSGYCGWLPFPHKQHPELVIIPKEERTAFQPPALSCADMALQDSQGLAINQRIAAEAADYLVRMLITKDLKKFATYIDLESGTAHSRYITEEAITAYVKN